VWQSRRGTLERLIPSLLHSTQDGMPSKKSERLIPRGLPPLLYPNEPKAGSLGTPPVKRNIASPW